MTLLLYCLLGFISQYVQGFDVDKCINVGHYAANYIIQQSGVTLDAKPNIPST